MNSATRLTGTDMSCLTLMPSRFCASLMLSRNFQNFLLHLLKKGELQLDLADEITNGTLVTRDGKIVHAAVESALRG